MSRTHATRNEIPALENASRIGSASASGMCADTFRAEWSNKGRAGITLDGVFDQDPRFQTGERRFVVTVHEPTSRGSAASGGLPVSNYDHCVLSANTMKAFVQARRVRPTY